jgi:hypothetical protein
VVTRTYFLSYARRDEAVALRLAQDLIGAGFSVWVDQFDIRPSQHWDRAVETAVRGCHGMIVVLSPNSAASPNVADEVAVAIETGKDVIPVLIEPCTVPLRMTRMQFIDGTHDYGSALRRCIDHMRAGAPEAPQSAAPADQWQAAPTLELEILTEAERRLTGFMGPIAPRLVASAAREAKTQAELYARLAESIPNPVERKTFLDWLGEPATGRQVKTPRADAPVAPPQDRDIAPDELLLIAKALMRHLGPIARQLVAREQASAQSRRDLCERLGRRITCEADRIAFLKEVAAG